MGRTPEEFQYVSPWADQDPIDPEELRLAGEALHRLVFHFNPPSEDMDTWIAGAGRLGNVVAAYYASSIQAAAEGLGDGEQTSFIKSKLVESGHIGSDPLQIDEEYQIVSEGFERNRSYWNETLGHMRNMKNALADLPEELGLDNPESVT